MKIATFNINNVNRRLPNLLRWLKSSRADIVCLQELKSTDADFPTDAIRKAGYGAVWRGQKTWNGVAILARKAEPVLVRTGLPGDDDDTQARYIEAAVDGVIVTSIYLPNGNPQPGPKFDYKLEWFMRLRRHAATFIRHDVPVVLAAKRPQDAAPKRTSLPSMLPPDWAAETRWSAPAAVSLGLPWVSRPIASRAEASHSANIATKTTLPCFLSPTSRP